MNAHVGILLLVALPPMLPAQAMIETALGAGRAATSITPAQKAGQAIGAAFDSLGRILEPAASTSTTLKPETAKPAGRTVGKAPARSPKSAAKPRASAGRPVPEPKAEVVFEDPSGIEKGMEYPEIVRRFGPPSLKLTTGPGEATLSYAKKNASVGVTMRNGKVASVEKAGG